MQEASDFVDRKEMRSREGRASRSAGLVFTYGIIAALLLLVAGYATQWVIPALGAGFGIATTIISQGIASTGSYASWVIPVGAAGMAAIGGVAVVLLLVGLVKRAASQPYLVALPLLGALAGFAVDMYKDFYPQMPLVRFAFSALAGAVVVAAGLWWRRYGWLNKIAGALVMASPLLVMFGHAINLTISQGVGAAIRQVSLQSWLAMGGLVVILVVTGILGFAMRNEMNT
ncbi:MAG TPA: hypothetical protein VMU60_01040 [Syntrophobacteria bacterium]|nr:hypothetical protein [Syntrophobacteria bacterium]